MYLLFVLAFVLAVPQRSIAQSNEDKARVVGAGIGVVGKIIDSEINSRKEREKREAEIRRENEKEMKKLEESLRQEREAAAREKREREERERINRENEAREREERENRARAEWFEARRASAIRIRDRENSLRDAVIAGHVAYDDYNRLGHTVNDLTGSVCFFSDRKEQVDVCFRRDNDNDQLLRISYRYDSNYGKVRGQNIYFPEVNVFIKYKNNQTIECVYQGPASFFVSPAIDYQEKLSTAFPIQKSVNWGNIDGIEIKFSGGQITTCY